MNPSARHEATSKTELPATTTPPAADQVVSGKQTSKGKSVTSPAITTTSGNQLVLAFVSATGPSGKSQKITKVSGGGLTWTLVTRADKQAGTAEVWQAHAVGTLGKVKITASLRYTGRDGAITVAAFTNATAQAGAHGTASGLSKTPAVSLTTTGPDSLVWATGEDATKASNRTPASGQALVNQVLDTGAHATYWTQQVTQAVTTANTPVKMADTTPTSDHWNYAAVEITAAPAAPTQISYSYDSRGNLTQIAPSSGQAITLRYDQANRLIAYGSTASYAYNGDGLRMSKTVGATTTAFAWDPSGVAPLLLSAGTTNYVYGIGNQPIEQIKGSTATYLLADQLGSIRLLTDASGNVVGTYSYSAYGATVGHTGTASALEYGGGTPTLKAACCTCAPATTTRGPGSS